MIVDKTFKIKKVYLQTTRTTCIFNLCYRLIVSSHTKGGIFRLFFVIRDNNLLQALAYFSRFRNGKKNIDLYNVYIVWKYTKIQKNRTNNGGVIYAFNWKHSNLLWVFVKKNVMYRYMTLHTLHLYVHIYYIVYNRGGQFIVCILFL